MSDVGIKHLTGEKGLVFLDVERTNVTAAGVKAFTDALPRCQINWDGMKTK